MKPGVSHSSRTGSSKPSHSCRKRAALSAASASIAPPRWAASLAITPRGRPSQAGQGGHHPRSPAATQLEHRALVEQLLDDVTDLVAALALLGHERSQPLGLRQRPGLGRAEEVGQVAPGELDGLPFVGRPQIDHAVGVLDLDRSHLRGMVHPQAAALDHRRPTHPDARVLGGDHHVAASEQGGVAGEAVAAGHPHQRDQATEGGEEGERAAVETRHDRHVDVARPAAAALGEQHDREPPPLGQLEQAVLLGVVAHSLRARQDGVVVGHDHARVAVHVAHAAHEPVGRAFARSAPRACAGAPGRRTAAARTPRRSPRRPARRGSPGRCGARARGGGPRPRPAPGRGRPRGARGPHGGRRVRPRAWTPPPPLPPAPASRAAPASPAAGPRVTASPTATASSRTTPSTSASTSCSIFIASSTTTGGPGPDLRVALLRQRHHDRVERRQHRVLGGEAHLADHPRRRPCAPARTGTSIRGDGCPAAIRGRPPGVAEGAAEQGPRLRALPRARRYPQDRGVRRPATPTPS